MDFDNYCDSIYNSINTVVQVSGQLGIKPTIYTSNISLGCVCEPRDPGEMGFICAHLAQGIENTSQFAIVESYWSDNQSLNPYCVATDQNIIWHTPSFAWSWCFLSFANSRGGNNEAAAIIQLVILAIGLICSFVLAGIYCAKSDHNLRQSESRLIKLENSLSDLSESPETIAKHLVKESLQKSILFEKTYARLEKAKLAATSLLMISLIILMIGTLLTGLFLGGVILGPAAITAFAVFLSVGFALLVAAFIIYIVRGCVKNRDKYIRLSCEALQPLARFACGRAVAYRNTLASQPLIDI